MSPLITFYPLTRDSTYFRFRKRHPKEWKRTIGRRARETRKKAQPHRVYSRVRTKQKACGGLYSMLITDNCRRSIRYGGPLDIRRGRPKERMNAKREDKKRDNNKLIVTFLQSTVPIHTVKAFLHIFLLSVSQINFILNFNYGFERARAPAMRIHTARCTTRSSRVYRTRARNLQIVNCEL